MVLHGFIVGFGKAVDNIAIVVPMDWIAFEPRGEVEDVELFKALGLYNHWYPEYLEVGPLLYRLGLDNTFDNYINMYIGFIPIANEMSVDTQTVEITAEGGTSRLRQTTNPGLSEETNPGLSEEVLAPTANNVENQGDLVQGAIILSEMANVVIEEVALQGVLPFKDSKFTKHTYLGDTAASAHMGPSDEGMFDIRSTN